jgi:hypothetical protein
MTASAVLSRNLMSKVTKPARVAVARRTAVAV